MATLDDEIGRKIAEAAASGELQSAPSWGKPALKDEGWAQTPDSLRMPFKILKDAGFAPPEVVLFHERAGLRAAWEAETSADARDALRRQWVDLEQRIALRLEGLRRSTML